MTHLTDALARHATQTPDAIALIDERGGAYSYARLWRDVQQTAYTLQQHDVTRLGLMLPNTAEWVVIDLAAQLCGVTLVPLPEFFSKTQIQHALTQSGCDFLIAPPQCIFEHASFVGALSHDAHLYRLEWCEKTYISQASKVTFTSGSTGAPKGVCLSAALIDELSITLADHLKSEQITRHAVLLPLGILLENIAGIYVPLLLGAKIILPATQGASTMTLQMLVNTLQRHRPDSLLLTAQGLRGLVNIAQQNKESVASLRYVAVGGGKISAALIVQARAVGIPVYEGYGLSECGSVVTLNTPDCDRLGSAGKPLPGVRVRVEADGEIVVERRFLPNYIGDRSAPLEVYTGDVGYIDDDGFVFITGRKKNVCINSFGRNFSPEWIEAQAQCCTHIAQVVLFGDARPFNVAVIQSTAGGEKHIDDELQTINQQLPDYARIHHFVIAAEPFTQSNGLLTGNGRPKRDNVYRRYQQDIEYFYETEVQQ